MTSCPQLLDGAEGGCPSRERENWLIFIELQLSTARTIPIKGGKTLGRWTCIWTAAFQVLLPL